MNALYYFAFLLYAGCCQTAEIEKCGVTFDIVTRAYPTPLPLLNPAVFQNVRNLETKIIINDYKHNSTGPSSYYPELTREYLKKDNYNIILVHADAYMFYSSPDISATYVTAIGVYVAETVLELNKIRRLAIKNLHFVGHGFGAHIAAVAANEIKTQTNQTVPRITALEIPKEGFENSPPSEKLDNSDAEIVDVIHTDAGDHGLYESLGDADFWANGGIPPQPDCDTVPEATRDCCNYDKSVWYFIYTINSEHGAVSCPSYQDFANGENCTPDETVWFGDNYKNEFTGNFYLYIVCRNKICDSSVAHVDFNFTRCED